MRRAAGLAMLLAVTAVAMAAAFWPARCLAQEVVRFDPAQVEVRPDGDRWKIVCGDTTVRAGLSEAGARDALAVLRHYRMDSRTVIGPFEMYLVRDLAPAGAMPGEKAYPLALAGVAARQMQGSWKVVAGDTWLLDFGGDENQARQAAELIHKYQFTHFCYVISAAKEMMYFRVDGPPAAPVVAPPMPPAPAPAGKAVLTVRVIEGLTTPARDPTVTLRCLTRRDDPPVARTENPTVFSLDAGTYEVAARVGSAGDTPVRRLRLQAGQTEDLTIRTATGTMELKLSAGQKPLRSIGVVQLRSGDKMVAALSDTAPKFQAMEGPYTVRVGLPSNQHIDIDGLCIEAGKTSTHTVDVPCAFLSVTAKGGAYGGGKRPYVRVDQAGKLVAALVETPARFQLLAGLYSVCVLEDGKRLGTRPVEIKPGADQDVEIDVAAPPQEEPKAAAAAPWPPAVAPSNGGPSLTKHVQMFTQGGELTCRAKKEAADKPVPPGDFDLKSGSTLAAAKAPVDLLFDDGSRLTLDAGAKVSVGLYENGTLVNQGQGRTWHRVRRPKDREFFYVVRTPQARFTALGTEFGLTLPPGGNGSGYVCVVEGDLVPRGTVIDENGREVPVYEHVPDGIRCAPPAEANRSATPGSPAVVVDGEARRVARITDAEGNSRDIIEVDASGSPRAATASGGSAGAGGGTISAGRSGTFQRLSYTGWKLDEGPIDPTDSWAARNRQLTRDFDALERERAAGRLSEADYRTKLRELFARLDRLMEDAPDMRFDPNARPMRVHVGGLRHVLNRLKSDPGQARVFDGVLPGGVAGFERFVNQVGGDGIVPESQRPYAIQLMRALGVPFTTDR